LITQQQFQKIEEFYDFDVPQYLQVITKYRVRITIEDFRGSSKHDVTFKNVIDYFSNGHGFSGLRQLGDVSGDWRQIDELARQCIEIFKILNPEKFMNGSRKIWIDNSISRSDQE